MRSTQTDWIAGNFITSPKPELSSQSFSDSAVRAGAYGGFNWQFLPRWVAGIEGDWGRAPKTTVQGGLLPGFAGIFFPIVPGDNVSVRTTWDASARGRLGFLLTPSVMIFGTAGVIWQGFGLQSVCGKFDCAPTATARLTDTVHAWTFGGGIEVQIARNWLARAEYRYADFGNAREVLNYPVPISLPATVDIALKTNTFMFGLAYRLDPSGASSAYAAADGTAWPQVAANKWSGPYVGASGGLRSTQFSWNTVAINGFPAPILLPPDVTRERFNNTAFRYGFYGGYNWQIAPQGSSAWKAIGARPTKPRRNTGSCRDFPASSARSIRATASA